MTSPPNDPDHQPAQQPPPPEQEDQPWPEQGRSGRQKRNKKLYVILAAVLALALVGGGLFFLRSEDEITYEGRVIVAPERVLTDAEANLDRIVEERNGATNDITACYFVARNAESNDVNLDFLICGPVLFVDGDETLPYLTFPFEASVGDGPATLTVAAVPDGFASTSWADNLRRPDGASPPAGTGGLAVPEPPRAEEGSFAVVPREGFELESTPDNARIGSPTMSIEVLAVGEPERYGRGDDARRPAEGEKFVAFVISSDGAEIGPVAEFSITVQVDDADPVPLPVASLRGNPAMAISVPKDTDDVSLVVTEGSIVQRLSLITGEPDPGNIALWQRVNRDARVDFSQRLTIRESAPGFSTEDFPSTLSVIGVSLRYFVGPENLTPSAPTQAFLDLGAILDIGGQFGLLPPPFWSLTLADGTVVAASDLNADPTRIDDIYFEVPANFSVGTLTFGGVGSNDGVIFDTLGTFVTVPIAIPEG